MHQNPANLTIPLDPQIDRLGGKLELPRCRGHANRTGQFDRFSLVISRKHATWDSIHFGLLPVDKRPSTYPSEKPGLVHARTGYVPYRGVPRKYIHLYLGEICCRFNQRKEDLKPLLNKLLHNTTVSEIKLILVPLG